MTSQQSLISRKNIPENIVSQGISLGSQWIQDLSTYNPVQIDSVSNIKPSDIAEIVYTSGTTGNPKGVELSHRNLISNSKGIFESFNFTNKDKFLTITPLFHNSGQLFTTLSPEYSYMLQNQDPDLTELLQNLSEYASFGPDLLNQIITKPN